MVLTQTLGGEIKDYISKLIGKEARIVDGQGVCLSSPVEAEIGTSLLMPYRVSELSTTMSHVMSGKNNLYIPLDYQNEIVAALILEEDEAKIHDYLPLIKSFAELLIGQYYENNRPLLDSTDQFLIKLLNNATPSEYPLFESESKVLGYNLNEKRLAIVIHMAGFWERCLLSLDQPSFERDAVIANAKRKIEGAINGFFSKNNDIIIGYLGSDKFVVFKSLAGTDEEDLKKFLNKSFKSIFEPLKNYRIEHVSVGYGNSYRGIGGLVTAFREADLSLELGQKLWGADRSFFFGDLGILTILGEGNVEKNLKFSNQLLSKLKSDELIKTLECFFDQNLSLTETALEMGVHRNTIIYRLNQIAKILGADPRIFEQAMTIKIALLVQRLFG